MFEDSEGSLSLSESNSSNEFLVVSFDFQVFCIKLTLSSSRIQQNPPPQPDKTKPAYDDEIVQARYKAFLQEQGLSPDFGCELTDSESEFSDDSEDLEEWTRISKQMIDSSDDSGDEKVKPKLDSSVNKLPSFHGSNFVCEICKKSFGYKRNLQTHWMMNHSEAEWNPVQIAFHQQTTDNLGVVCGICKKIIKFKGNLLRHLKVMHPERDLTQARTLSTALNVQNREQTVGGKYRCNIVQCQKSFKTSSSLQNHLARHAGKIS
jgi:Zinc finger, C2H2 type